jgi:hypothetical protein
MKMMPGLAAVELLETLERALRARAYGPPATRRSAWPTRVRPPPAIWSTARSRCLSRHRARARNTANTGAAYNAVGSTASPLNLLTSEAPISNDQVAFEFGQRIDAGDALRSGTYGKTLTFTLSTTTP